MINPKFGTVGPAIKGGMGMEVGKSTEEASAL